MAQKDINKLMIKISDEGALNNLLELSIEKLVVIDFNQSWCGPCEVMQPTFLRIFNEVDNAEDKIILASITSTPTFAKTIQDSIPSELSTNLNIGKFGCMPLFVLYKEKKCVSVIQGVDAPLMWDQITLHLQIKAE